MTTNQDEVREEAVNNISADRIKDICIMIYATGYKNAKDPSNTDRGDWSRGYSEIKEYFDALLAKKKEALREVMEGNEMAQEEIDQYLSILS